MGQRLNALWTMGIFVAPIVAAFLMCGCGGGKHRTINVAAGEYYTEDEIVQLSEGRHSEYCSDLESQRAVVQGQFEALTAEVARTSDAITAARKRQDDLERQLLAVESDLRTLDDQLEEVRALPTTWKVRPGESLSSISALPEIYNDVDKWWKLYEVNKDKVPDPYFCFPDTVIVIPRDWPVD